jgi:hypothetical protein
MLEKLSIDPVRNPNSSYMKSLGMTVEEANTATWTVPSTSDSFPAPTALVQPQPAPALTPRAARWGKKSDIPLKEEPTTATSSLAEGSNNVPIKLHTSRQPETKTTPANTSVPAIPVKSFASAAAAPRTDSWNKKVVVPARQPSTTSAWGQHASPSAPATNTIPVTSEDIKKEPPESVTSTKWETLSVATEREFASTSPRSTQDKWDMPETPGWETFGAQCEESVTNDSDVWSLKSTPVSTASYAQSIASTNTEPCSPRSPADVTAGLGRMTIGSCQPQVIYSAKEWQAITDKGRNARRGRYYGQPSGSVSGGKRGGW